MEQRQRSVEGVALNDRFWKGRRVVVTGHTGFKGAWLALWLHHAGAHVSGFALAPSTRPSAYELMGLPGFIDSRLGDVRDTSALHSFMQQARPEVVFHLASQAIVRESLRDPASTFVTNVVGLVNVIEALRALDDPVALVNVTSDKVYQNDGNAHAFVEGDRLGGIDPYSASKACAEIVTSSYRSSVLSTGKLRVSTARAGNVIGGGDWSADRIVPDIVRAIQACEQIVLRYPRATRPWQHVLDPLDGYAQLAEFMLTRGSEVDGAYNFGPACESDAPTVADLTGRFLEAFGSSEGWRPIDQAQPPEMQQLRIDSSKARTVLKWSTKLSLAQAIDWTVVWYQAWRRSQDMRIFSQEQIESYQGKSALA